MTPEQIEQLNKDIGDARAEIKATFGGVPPYTKEKLTGVAEAMVAAAQINRERQGAKIAALYSGQPPYTEEELSETVEEIREAWHGPIKAIENSKPMGSTPVQQDKMLTLHRANIQLTSESGFKDEEFRAMRGIATSRADQIIGLRQDADAMRAQLKEIEELGRRCAEKAGLNAGKLGVPKGVMAEMAQVIYGLRDTLKYFNDQLGELLNEKNFAGKVYVGEHDLRGRLMVMNTLISSIIAQQSS